MKSSRFCLIACSVTSAVSILLGILLYASARKHESAEAILRTQIAISRDSHVIMLYRLNTNDLLGVRFMLEMSVDDCLLDYWNKGQIQVLQHSENRAFERAKDYRKLNPFKGEDYKIDRSPDVEKLIQQIILLDKAAK